MSPSGLAEGHILGGSRAVTPRVPGAFRIYPIWTVYILWQVHSAKSGPTCRLLSPGSSTTVAVPGDLVYCVDRHATGLYRPHVKCSYRTGYGEGGQSGPMVSSMDGVPRTIDYDPAVIRLRGGHRYLAVQPNRCAVATSLSCF